jgi:class 3 adenylate cyclase
MDFSEEIKKEVRDIFKSAWGTRAAQKVPEDDDLKLTNDGVEIDGTVLYADLAESTDLVSNYKPTFAAEVYKAYLKSASRIIRANEGIITAFDGDRVMAVFFGNSKNTQAARTALHIEWAVIAINAELRASYGSNLTYVIRQAVGVDTGKLLVARTGIRGSNDLVWVGTAANRAAKLCAIRDPNYTSFLTGAVYDVLHDSSKYSIADRKNMWTQLHWSSGNIDIYGSNWWLKP